MPSPPGPPMTLGNMRELGVRSLAVTCDLCHHRAVLPADRWSDASWSAPSGLEWSAPAAGLSAPMRDRTGGSSRLRGDE
jgi:hypothetical protein